jgi:hypothetical protein
VLIEYVGFPGIRKLEGYQWDKNNGYVVEVEEVEMAMDLLTAPRSDFQIWVEEPLLKIVDQEAAKVLLFYGIVSVAALAAYGEEADDVQEALAAEIGCELKELRGWIRSAGKLVH